MSCSVSEDSPRPHGAFLECLFITQALDLFLLVLTVAAQFFRGVPVCMACTHLHLNVKSLTPREGSACL